MRLPIGGKRIATQCRKWICQTNPNVKKTRVSLQSIALCRENFRGLLFLFQDICHKNIKTFESLNNFNTNSPFTIFAN